MMAKTPKTADTSEVLERIGDLEMTFIKPLGAFGTAVADAWLDLCEEWTGFVTRRLRQDVRTANAMLHCHNPAELPKIQAAFFQKAMDEYQEEAGRVNAVLQEASRKFSSGDAQDHA